MLNVSHLLDFFKNIIDSVDSFKLGNHSQLGTWKPVTFSRITYKIFTKLSPKCIKVHLFEIICSNEIVFAMRRNVNLDNAFFMHDAMEWVVESKQKLISFLRIFENIAIRLIKRVIFFFFKNARF
jgi:hypothetical protein